MKQGEKNNTTSLRRSIFFNLLGVAIVSVISLGIFWTQSKLHDYHKDVKLLKKTYSETKKLEIRNKILQVKDYIRWIEDRPLIPLSQTITDQLNRLKLPVIKSGNFHASLPHAFKDSVCSSRVPVYVIANNGNVVYSYNPFSKSGQSKPDEKETSLLLQISERKTFEGTFSLYKKIALNDSSLEVIGCRNKKILPGFDVVSVVCSANFENLLQIHVLDSVSRLRYAQNEYIFVNSFDGKALVTNGRYNKNPIDIFASKNTVWINIFKIQQTAAFHPEGVFKTYAWAKLVSSDTSFKTSYFSYIPKWKWIIGTGFYEDDVNSIIKEKRNSLYADMRKSLFNIVLYLIISSLLCYILVIFFSKRFGRNIALFKNFFERASEENVLIDKSQVSFGEFASMADAANQMVDERKKIEIALKESEVHYRYLFEHNPAAMLIYELGSLAILAVNDAFLDHYGYSRDEILKMQLTDLYPENEKESIANLTTKLTGLAYVGEWHHIKKDGTQITIDVNSHGVTYENRDVRIAVINDITVRKKAEEETKQLTQQLLRAEEIAHFGFLDWNLITNDIYLSPEINRIYGIPDDVINVAEFIAKVVHPDDMVFVNENLGLAIQGIKEYNIDHRIIRPDGKIIWLNARGELYKDENEKPVRLLGTIMDITERKLAEEEIKKLNLELENRVNQRTAQLATSNKELESFSYSISHDLRAPLRAIYGFSQILSKRHRSALDEEGRQYMDYIVEASIRMEQLINDLLNYSRLGRKSLEKHPVSLNTIVESVHSDFKHHLEEIGGKLVMETELPKIPGDESLLRQIFTNLIGNAITYRRLEVPLIIKLSSEEDTNDFILKINDNGIGIPREYWEKIFNVFQRLHSEDKYPGTGIGLASVKKAVTLLGGTVWVESVVGVGSTFIIKLPTY
jgi:PAS domain S-box-containing protein